MKKNILIIGSSSFSGASLIDFLLNKNKFNLFGTSRRKKKNIFLPYVFNKNYKKFKNYKIDIVKNQNRLATLIKKIKPEIIIDFASICMVNESWKNPETYFNVNSFSKIKLIESLLKKNFLKKYIYISTPEIFGSSKGFINEKHSIFKPQTPYATSKLSFELLLKNYNENYKLPLIIARFSNFFGPGQPLHRLIPKLIACIDNKIKFPLQGDGKSKRNFIYSYDFSNAIYKIISQGRIGETYHFSGNTFYSVKEIIKTICNLKFYKYNRLVKRTKSRIGQDFIYKLGTSRTKKLLNWKPMYSLKRSLQEIINYHNKYIKVMSKEDLIYKDNQIK